jgi:phytoene synthase
LQVNGAPGSSTGTVLQAHTQTAYRQCESLTRAAAGNFYYGIRLLPGHKRRAMCAVYAFARRVDDIADGMLEPQEKLRRLDAAAATLERLEPKDPDPVLAALADASVRFDLPTDALRELIEGVRMDVTGVSYTDFEELELYCRRVAGSIGRLCLAIFGVRGQRHGPSARGMADADDLGVAQRSGRSASAVASDLEVAQRPVRSASAMADDLGVAMQIANIVRDLREDAEHGRVYLPAKELMRYHLHKDAPLEAHALVALARQGSMAEPSVVAGFDGGDVGQLYALMRFQCLRSRDMFHRGLELVELLDRRSAACVLAMAGIYWRLLGHIEERPDRALAQRMRLKRWEKAWVAARALVGRGVPERHPAERVQADGAAGH